ncbi:MAG TPA: DUF433 domain-containing protein [Candidatus Saccharimonadales bacterium]|nr:DUF433 domain-containing protein [Candidatus Saccharimonadales bacterium]
MKHGSESLEERIVVDERIMVGKPIIKGTRITVQAIVRRLAEGHTTKKILKEYPNLKREDIKAAMAYAARLVEAEEIIPNVRLEKIHA